MITRHIGLQTLFSLVVGILLISRLSYAHPGYQKRIPNGANVLGGEWPGVGHMSPGGGDARNPFGRDFAAAGHAWTVELCQKDSDGDELTNGQELGDPLCVWKPGDAPNRTHHITHPGFKEGQYPVIPQDTCKGVTPDADEIQVNMTFSNYAIPAKLTTYACQRFDMPDIVNNADHHIVRFDPIIDRRDIVHHLIVFSCLTLPPTTDPWECGLEMPAGCKEFVWGWALGGRSECVPEEAGIPVGRNGPHFFVIQMHYNNELRVADAIDSSGVSLHITPHLRPLDAGVFLSGAAENDIAVPPRMSEFEVVTDCPSFCTESAFPPTGIYVYAYLLHMHLLGAKMWTDVTYVNGTTQTLGIVPVYDFNSQTWIPITPPLKLMPGDRLVTHCVYNSMDRENVTLGGASTEEEMCTANLAYFPRIAGLDLCTNFTDEDDVRMGRCAGFDFDWDTHEKFPICDLEDIPPQAATIASSVLPICKNGKECSVECKNAIAHWATNSTCVRRNGLWTVLQLCGPHQADCNAVIDMIQSPCLDMCFPGERRAPNTCGNGRTCSKNFTCEGERIVDTCSKYVPDAQVQTLNLTFTDYAVPKRPSTFVCQKFDLPGKFQGSNYQIVRFDPVVTRPELLESITVLRCSTPPASAAPFECGLTLPSGCKEVVWGWTAGAGSFCTPPQAGVSVGVEGNDYLVVQLHYANDQSVSGALDSSGVTLHLTPNRRQYDAGVLLSGAAQVDIRIPPKMPAFHVGVDCPAYCTEQALPETGVWVYAYFMHMHELGTSAKTEITYENGTTAVLAEVKPFHLSQQTWIPIDPPAYITQGDQLLTKCTYNSNNRVNVTIGGGEKTQEICTANFAYYPRIPEFTLCNNYTDGDKKMGRCAGFDFNWNSGERYPICDAGDIPTQASQLMPSVISQCQKGQQCSGLCRQAILTWIRNSKCVARNGLRAVLQNCGNYQSSCDDLSKLMDSKCLRLCYFDDPVGTASCGVGRKCDSYACSDATNNRIIILAATITIVFTIAVIGASILTIAKCGRFKHRKVEYVG